MRKIAFVTQKGGSGKSTLAISLALAAQEAGERVFLIDMDPQRSLGNWASAREGNELPVEFITPAKLPRAIAELEKSKISLVIIDTPSTETPAADAAIKAADICVIPARPTVFDLWSSELTRSKIKSLGKEFCFVLNQCPPMADSQRVQDGVGALEAMGGLLSPLVVSRADYQEAARYGLGPTEYAPEGKAANEMRQLWSSLKRRFNKMKSAATKEPAKIAAKKAA